ncbi:MAG: ATP-binding protein [Nitrospirae bacterium]|nr:ATP-binding protein [Nitrospirota bacterium]
MRKQSLWESETVEFKKSLAELKQGLISMAAILNKHQAGTLWFGVRNDGDIVGIEVTGKTLRDISQSIAAHIEPRIFPRISEVTMEGKQCVRIDFEGHDIPYFVYGRAFMRVVDPEKCAGCRFPGNREPVYCYLSSTVLFGVCGGRDQPKGASG